MSVPPLNNFIAAKEAALIVGYTPDYVSKLARDGEVSAEQRGRQWFVDLDSLKLFSLRAASEQRKRQEILRDERLRELSSREIADHLSGAKNVLESKHPIAAALSVVVVICLLLSAQLSFVAYSERVTPVALLGGLSDISQSLKSVFSFWSWGANFHASKEATHTPEHQSGLLLLERNVSSTEIDGIVETFSDEVQIVPEDSTRGVITPVFVNGESEESYQYVLVPLNKNSSDVGFE